METTILDSHLKSRKLNLNEGGKAEEKKKRKKKIEKLKSLFVLGLLNGEHILCNVTINVQKKVIGATIAFE